MHHFPQELTDQILDHLHDDRFSLFECSLVCWAWIPATRFHLFANLTLRRRWNRFMYPQFRPFLEFLATETCTLAPFVAQLTLEDLDATSAEGDQFKSAFSILTRLKSVTFLTFKQWRNLGAQPVQDLLPHLPVLSEITLEGVAVDSAAQLFSYLDACPVLTSLTLRWVSWGPSQCDVPVVYSYAGSIRTLRLVDCRINEFLAVVCPEYPSPSSCKLVCTTVEIDGIVAKDAQSIGRLLNAVENTLQHLTIGFTNENMDDFPLNVDAEKAFCRYVDLGKHRQLRTLRVNNIIMDQSLSSTTLSTLLRAPHLTELKFTLVLWGGTLEDLDSLDWNEIDRILSSTQLDSLHQVEFHIENTLRGEVLLNLGDAVRARLPQSYTRRSILVTSPVETQMIFH
ncbi:hypothetical protein B0H11DRAFT_1976104 [Mycena galericulata]|nr:hypothetical protein B0H11DRAFT_1976104 [Mycena galericulata]